MDETLTLVDAGQESAEGSQIETVESTTDVSAEPVEQQVEKPKQTPEENAQFKALRLAERQAAEKAAAEKAENRTYETLAAKNKLTKLDGTPIKTKADWEEWESTSQQMEALIVQGKTQEEALAKIEANQAKAELAKIRQQQSVMTQVEKESNEFIARFEELNGRKFTQEDRAEIQASGILDRAASEGVPLKYVYSEFYANQKRQKEMSLEIGKKTAEVNALNAATSTGSVKGGGAADNSVLTEAVINSHKNDTAWMYKNYNKVQEFYKKKG